jgi:hypothetical protein
MQSAINPKHLSDLDRLVEISQEMLASDFELWSAVIRSDQVPHEHVPSIFQSNPEFAHWYQQRYLEHDREQSKDVDLRFEREAGPQPTRRRARSAG